MRKGCGTGKAPGSQPGQVHHGEASHTKRISTGVGCDLRASAKRTDERTRLVGKGKVHKHGDVKDLRDYPHATELASEHPSTLSWLISRCQLCLLISKDIEMVFPLVYSRAPSHPRHESSRCGSCEWLGPSVCFFGNLIRTEHEICSILQYFRRILRTALRPAATRRWGLRLLDIHLVLLPSLGANNGAEMLRPGRHQLQHG